jgi:uracil-DNA glycosylase
VGNRRTIWACEGRSFSCRYRDVSHPITSIRRDVVACRRCPRLVEWREEVAETKRKAYRDQTYWGRAVPGFGDPKAKLVLVGLAPGAHGANRTGRMFTGDRSGDFLYAALHRAGLANQPTSVAVDDGLALTRCYITAPVRCVPPKNAPTREELAQCSSFFERELQVLKPSVLLTLGHIAWGATWAFLRKPAPVSFSHGARAKVENGPTVLASYHVSQQNTQTGRLTAAMFDHVVAEALSLLDLVKHDSR